MFADKYRLNPSILKVLGLLVLISFACCVMVAYRVVMTREINYLYMVWNLFLAWIPVTAATAAAYFQGDSRGKKGNTVLLWLLGFLWLLFYPNAAYIITDFIHLDTTAYYKMQSYYMVVNTDIVPWYDLVLFCLFAWAGVLNGFFSMFLIQQMVNRKIGKGLSWVFVAAVSLLGGYGIYLGRFIRWNSWDIISNPLSLFASIVSNINSVSMKLTVLFGGFIALIYIVLYGMTNLNRKV